MIYATFTLWLLLVLLVGTGTYRLWSRLAKPAWVNWALLPGSIVSEMAYIFGCLITGGEIRHAKILPGKPDGRTHDDGQPGTEAAPRLKLIGPVVASAFAIVACAAAILVVHALLGEPVIAEFAGGGLATAEQLPKALPTSWDGFWDQAKDQAELLKRMCEALADVRWANWRVPLFVYLALCLSIRLAPTGKPVRPTLAAAVALAALIALIAAVSTRFRGLIEELWPLLTYVWTSLLAVLVVTLLATGVAALVRAILDKEPKPAA